VETRTANDLHLLGIARLQSGQINEAVRLIREAIALAPQVPEYRNNLGNALVRAERIDEAILAFREAVRLRPAYAKAHSNLGGALRQSGQFALAREAYGRAITADPKLAEAHWNLGVLLMMEGKYREAWPEFEYRLELAGMSEGKLPGEYKRWDGKRLEGRTILVIPEQGLGDAIQFARFVPLVVEMGGKVVLQVRRELRLLFESLASVDSLVLHGDPLPAADVYSPMLSLPMAFNTSIESLPAEVPYLSAPEVETERFQSRMSSAAGIKVGLAWAGDPKHKNDSKRSISPHILSELVGIPNVSFFSLQKERSAQDDMELIDWTADLHDFADTAALISNLDLVITVDTAVAHLAGAMGKPVWVLLRHSPDWRWMLDRDDSPWYPTMRLFRQQTPGDWAGIISVVATELKEFCHGKAV
jgi:hypothetical protein